MTTLYERLMARIGELERIAKAAMQAGSVVAPAFAEIEAGGATRCRVCGCSDVVPCEVRFSSASRGQRRTQYARHITAWDPATVLRGLAEDRDILQRHPHSTHGGDLFCGACGWVGGPGPDGDLARLAGVEPGGWIGERGCPEVLSLARRHGVEVTS